MMNDENNYLRYMMESVAETAKVMNQFNTLEEKRQVHAIWNNLSVALDEFLGMYALIEDPEERDLFLDKLMSQMDDIKSDYSDQVGEEFIKFPSNKEKPEA